MICQFPTGNGEGFEWTLVNHLKAYGGRLIFWLYDVETLAMETDKRKLPETLRLYSQAEVLIVPSLAMRRFLLDNGIKDSIKFVVQEMWDYTTGADFASNPQFRKELHYTGGSFAGMPEVVREAGL